MTKIKMICSHCKSEDVVKDAWASWNKETQEWELSQTFDANFCNNCEESRSIDEIPIHQGPVLIVDETGTHPNNLDQAVKEQTTYYQPDHTKRGFTPK